jgi:L-rhamnose mutarotase
MKRVGMTWRVDRQFWEGYREIHMHPWPELLQAFAEHGVHNFNCYALGTRVFAYLEIEGDDVLQVLGEVAQTEIKKKWDAEVTVQVLPTAADDCDQQFLEIERIFYAP